MTKLPRTHVHGTSQKRLGEWLASEEIDAGFLGEDLKFSLLLLDQYEPGADRILAERAELGELSWLGGPALGPLEQWPRNVDGEPLAHVATIHLSEAHALLESDDFTEAEDTAGWLVRHVPFPGEDFPPLISAPKDLDLPHEVCQPVLLGAGVSLPGSVDFADADDASFAAAERVQEELYATWMAWRGGVEAVTGPVIPTSHLYGHSDAGTGYAHDILHQVRPLTGSEDAYVLVLSVESWTHLDGWFGDPGNFEVWMRASDLRTGQFDQAWCMIHTDH